MSEPQVRSGDRSRPLAEVKARAARLAAGLTGLGVAHGDRYAVILRNETAYLEASLAGGLIGAVPVAVNWHWSGDDLHHVLHDSTPVVAVVHSDLLPAVEAHAPAGTRIVEVSVPPEVVTAYHLTDAGLTGRHVTLEQLVTEHEPATATSDDPPMSMIYTSGTTGLPKGILRQPIGAAQLRSLVEAVTFLFKLTLGGVTMLPAPLYHTAPNVNATFAVALGMDITIMPRFDAEEFLRLVEERRVETVQMVPTMFTRLLQLPPEVRDRYDISSLRAIVHAAAPCSPETKQAMIDWVGPIVHEYYGGSEGGAWTVCDSTEALAHPGTVGRPAMGSDVRILDLDGNPLPAGKEGIVHGRSMQGWPDFTYHGNDEKRRAIEVDGYLTIGDVGRLDEEGYLYLSDRLDDMVISGGVNIYPAEIEACLQQLEGVADVAVFGIPDEEFGQALAAHVQPLAGATLPGGTLTEAAVRAHVAAHLAGYKVPRVVVFEEQLPREDSGKLFKRRLKERYRAPPTRLTSSSPDT